MEVLQILNNEVPFYGGCGELKEQSEEEMSKAQEYHFMSLPFTELGGGTLTMLANVLSLPQGGDWREVANKCGFSSIEIQSIFNMDKPDGSNAMQFLRELNMRAHKPTIGQLHTILMNCGRRDAASLVANRFEEFVRADAENSQPLDLTTNVKRLPGGMPTPPVSPYSMYQTTAPFLTYQQQAPINQLPHNNHGNDTTLKLPITSAPQLPPHSVPQLPPHSAPQSQGAPFLQNGRFPQPSEQPMYRAPGVHPQAPVVDSQYIRGPNNALIPNPGLQVRLPVYQHNQGPVPCQDGAMHDQRNMYQTPKHIQDNNGMRQSVNHMGGGGQRATHDMDDSPPPLMSIDHIDQSISPPPPPRSRSPPPPYEPEDSRWRTCSSRGSATSSRSALSPHSLASPEPDRAPAEDLSMDTDDSNSSFDSLKRRFDNVGVDEGQQRPNVNSHHGRTETQQNCDKSSSLKDMVKQEKGDTCQISDKLSKENQHQFVLNKLRNAINTKENRGKHKHSSHGSEQMDTDDPSRSMSALVPTVVETNFGDNFDDKGEAEDACKYLTKEKANTFPRTRKAGDLDMSNKLKESSSCLSKLENAPFKVKEKIKVFLTFATGDTPEEHARVMKDVAYLTKVLRKNKFEVFIDTGIENARQDLMQRFYDANFVLVCISTTYKHEVKSKDLQRPSRDMPVAPNNARRLYRMMQKEFKANGYNNNRFIPVLLTDTSMPHAPDWFLNICPAETFYSYPQHMRSLVYHMTSPDKVMKKFVEKQNLNRQVESLPVTPSPGRVHDDKNRSLNFHPGHSQSPLGDSGFSSVDSSFSSMDSNNAQCPNPYLSLPTPPNPTPDPRPPISLPNMGH